MSDGYDFIENVIVRTDTSAFILVYVVDITMEPRIINNDDSMGMVGMQATFPDMDDFPNCDDVDYVPCMLLYGRLPISYAITFNFRHSENVSHIIMCLVTSNCLNVICLARRFPSKTPIYI